MQFIDTLVKFVCTPLSKIYGGVTFMRNKLFDWGIWKQTEFDIPIICVGNLSVGGTGKTPHTEYIVRLLSQHYNIGILSRGYKRRTKGFVLATPHSTPRHIGDEAYQMYHKFGRKIMVAVCEKRVVGIEKMLEINPDINLIILDDAFQHRYVKPKVSILLTEHHRPYYNDKLLPLGRLRESAKGVSRADIVIVTKCPSNIKAIEYRIHKKYLDLIPAQSLFFSRYIYDRPRPVFPSLVKNQKELALEYLSSDYSLLAVCGIGNPKPFIRFLKSFSPKVKYNIFPDHHDFSRKDMDTIKARFLSLPKNRRYILTTEKDAVRLINNPYLPHEIKPYIYFIPIRTSIDETDSLSFEDTLLKYINS